MTMYTITSKAGVGMGTYEGSSKAEALAAVHRDAGYDVACVDGELRFPDAATRELCGDVADWLFETTAETVERLTPEIVAQAAEDALAWLEACDAEHQPREPLDPAKSEWDSRAWEIVCADPRWRNQLEVPEVYQALWPVYSAALVAETKRLCESEAAEALYCEGCGAGPLTNEEAEQCREVGGEMLCPKCADKAETS